MKISIISAIGKNRVIGINNKLPWHLPADLAHFKKVSLGKSVIMGQKTFESLGKPLPDRKNIVITDNKYFKPAGCEVVYSLDEAVDRAGDAEEVIIMGGASIYRQFLPRTNRMYLTMVDAAPEGDAFFPEYNLDEWKEISREDHNADDKNPHKYSFLILDRIK